MSEEIVPESKGNVHYFPYVSYGDIVNQLVKQLYDLELIIAFNYGEWDTWKEYKQLDNFEDLDKIEVCKMLTVMVRADRFCEGVMAGWFRDGTTLKLLTRLSNIVYTEHKIRHFRKPRKWPVCKGNKVVNIMYGYPSENIEEGKLPVKIGGCCIREDAPQWHCYDCNNQYYKAQKGLVLNF